MIQTFYGWMLILVLFPVYCWRVLSLGENVIIGCQVCLDTDGILYTNTSPQIESTIMLLVNSSGPTK